MYIGAILPFEAWGSGDLGLSPWRLVVLFILVLILRRLPALLALYKIIPSLRNLKEATFVGYFVRGDSSCAVTAVRSALCRD